MLQCTREVATKFHSRHKNWCKQATTSNRIQSWCNNFKVQAWGKNDLRNVGSTPTGELLAAPIQLTKHMLKFNSAFWKRMGRSKGRKTCSWLAAMQRVLLATRWTDKARWCTAWAWNIWRHESWVIWWIGWVTQWVGWNEIGSLRSLGWCIPEIYWASAYMHGRGLAVGPKRVLNVRSASNRVHVRNWRGLRWCWCYLYGWWWCKRWPHRR